MYRTRYYGKSLPYSKGVTKHMGYLAAEQALADYAQLIMEIKAEFKAHDAAVIGGCCAVRRVGWGRRPCVDACTHVHR